MLAMGDILENILQLMHLHLCFLNILNITNCTRGVRVVSFRARM